MKDGKNGFKLSNNIAADADAFVVVVAFADSVVVAVAVVAAFVAVVAAVVMKPNTFMTFVGDSGFGRCGGRPPNCRQRRRLRR